MGHWFSFSEIIFHDARLIFNRTNNEKGL